MQKDSHKTQITEDINWILMHRVSVSIVSSKLFVSLWVVREKLHRKKWHSPFLVLNESWNSFVNLKKVDKRRHKQEYLWFFLFDNLDWVNFWDALYIFPMHPYYFPSRVWSDISSKKKKKRKNKTTNCFVSLYSI